MIHFGLSKLSYEIKFDAKCYHPISLEGKKTSTKFIAGVSFGYLWKQNSISIAWRPSYTHLKIDLFAYVFNKGKFFEDYVGSIEMDKPHLVIMKFDGDTNNYRIKIYDEERGEKKYHHMSYFRYPLFKWGYTKERLCGQNNIILEKQ